MAGQDPSCWIKPDRSIYSNGFVRVVCTLIWPDFEFILSALSHAWQSVFGLQAVVPIGKVPKETIEAWVHRLNEGYCHVRLHPLVPIFPGKTLRIRHSCLILYCCEAACCKIPCHSVQFPSQLIDRLPYHQLHPLTIVTTQNFSGQA
jgi:hypothetical protein